MSRLSYFLIEGNNYIEGTNSGRSELISYYTFRKLLETKCKTSQSNPLYRGLKSRPKSKYLYIDPSKHTRVSEYTENWYMLVMQLLPEWKKFPNLSKSVICTSSDSDAESWGALYKVYPFDGAKLGVTYKEHMWASFPNRVQDMNEINDAIKDILDINKMSVNINETNPDILLNVFNKIDKIKDRSFIDGLRYLHKGFTTALKRYRDYRLDTLLEVFGYVLEPNGFLLKNIGDTLPKRKQIWTESPCVMERLSDYNDDGAFIDNQEDTRTMKEI